MCKPTPRNQFKSSFQGTEVGLHTGASAYDPTDYTTLKTGVNGADPAPSWWPQWMKTKSEGPIEVGDSIFYECSDPTKVPNNGDPEIEIKCLLGGNFSQVWPPTI